MAAYRGRGGGLRGVIAAWLLALHERRHAARASDELLALSQSVKADHPDWSERELFKLTVMARRGCDSTAADAILRQAGKSFAELPVRRDLTLRDVAHQLSVTESLSAHEDDSGIRSNIARVVATYIASELCTIRARS